MSPVVLSAPACVCVGGGRGEESSLQETVKNKGEGIHKIENDKEA